MNDTDNLKAKEIIKKNGNCKHCDNTGRILVEFLYLGKIKQYTAYKCHCDLKFLWPNYVEIPKSKLSNIAH